MKGRYINRSILIYASVIIIIMIIIIIIIRRRTYVDLTITIKNIRKAKIRVLNEMYSLKLLGATN